MKKLDEIRKVLRIAARQTTMAALERRREQFDRELKASRDRHDREMKEIRVEFKKMVQRIEAQKRARAK